MQPPEEIANAVVHGGQRAAGVHRVLLDLQPGEAPLAFEFNQVEGRTRS